MSKARLEAFSDGVIAILITIMVLELRPPEGASWADLRPMLPVFLTYVLSFVFLGIYWNNHHHMLHASTTVSGRVLWANLHLLFWLSLFPFATGWMGENHFATLPTAIYGGVLLAAAHREALGDVLARPAHVALLEGAPQAVVDHRVDERAVAHAQPFAEPRHQVRQRQDFYYATVTFAIRAASSSYRIRDDRAQCRRQRLLV